MREDDWLEGRRVIADNGVRVGEAIAYESYSEPFYDEATCTPGKVWRWANDSCDCCWSDMNPQPIRWTEIPQPPA